MELEKGTVRGRTNRILTCPGVGEHLRTCLIGTEWGNAAKLDENEQGMKECCEKKGRDIPGKNFQRLRMRPYAGMLGSQAGSPG